MAGWSQCGEPVPFARLLFGRVADSSLQGKRRAADSARRRRQGTEQAGVCPSLLGQMAAAPAGSGAPGERQGRREEDGEVRAVAAGAELRFPAPENRRGAAGFVRGLGYFIPSQTVIRTHPTFRATANIRGGIGRKEGGSTEAASFVSVPRLPIPGAHCSLPPSGLWPCLVLFRALCVGRGEEGAGRPSVQKLWAEREG